MKVTGSAVSLTVADPEASARFLEQTFGFEREMAADGFVSLTRPDVGFNVIYLRAGLPTFRPRDRAARTADGLLVVLVVDDIDAEYGRLIAAGGEILTPIQTEDWGERYFQVADPNGVIVQLVQWVTTAPASLRAQSIGRRDEDKGMAEPGSGLRPWTVGRWAPGRIAAWTEQTDLEAATRRSDAHGGGPASR